MPFFDFHIHPTLKSLFSEEKDGFHKLSPWKKLDSKNIPFLVKCCSEIGYILASQGNLMQLNYNECRLICVALHIPEKDILTDPLMADASKGKLSAYLQPNKMAEITNGNPYQILLNDDWLTLTDATQFGITDKKVKPIKSAADFNESDETTVHVVFSVEGCHTLTSALQHFDVNEIIINLDDLRSKVALLSLNLTHMEQSPICNHAFGMLFLSNEGFRPTGKGISQYGISIIKHCYQHKIMIDIKHMSLGARQQLYALRNTDEFKPINQPIVCTHAGFTGISFTEIPDYMFNQRSFKNGYYLLWQGKPVKYGGNNARPSFNASSINLYDEDIAEILISGGIIGFSLDKRILGYQEYEQETSGRDDYPTETEYISTLEANLFFQNKKEIGSAFENNYCLGWEEIEDGANVNTDLSEYHLTYFMAHILHVIVVAGKINFDINQALKQICIGADFDGLINPIWICSSVDELVYFKDHFINEFENFASQSNMQLPSAFDIKTFADQLFYTNGRDFVLNRLNTINN